MGINCIIAFFSEFKFVNCIIIFMITEWKRKKYARGNKRKNNCIIFGIKRNMRWKNFTSCECFIQSRSWVVGGMRCSCNNGALYIFSWTSRESLWHLTFELLLRISSCLLAKSSTRLLHKNGKLFYEMWLWQKYVRVLITVSIPFMSLDNFSQKNSYKKFPNK